MNKSNSRSILVTAAALLLFVFVTPMTACELTTIADGGRPDVCPQSIQNEVLKELDKITQCVGKRRLLEAAPTTSTFHNSNGRSLLRAGAPADNQEQKAMFQELDHRDLAYDCSSNYCDPGRNKWNWWCPQCRRRRDLVVVVEREDAEKSWPNLFGGAKAEPHVGPKNFKWVEKGAHLVDHRGCLPKSSSGVSDQVRNCLEQTAATVASDTCVGF